MVLQSQLNFSYVCFSYVKEYGPVSEEQTEKNRRYAEYEKERWTTYFMFLEWKKMADEMEETSHRAKQREKKKRAKKARVRTKINFIY